MRAPRRALTSDMLTRPIAISIFAAAAALVAPGSADADVSAYADAVKANTNDYYRAWSISKLTTWKVGQKCWDKIVAPNSRILDLTSFMTREIAAYAKQVTGDDWATIEGSGMSEKEANKAKI